MDSVLRNPYFYCGTVLSRAGVSGATMVWALLILVTENTFAQTAYGRLIGAVPQLAYGIAWLSISTTLLVRLVRKCRPHPIEGAAYGALFLWWGMILMVLIFEQRPWYATTTAGVSLVTAAAWFAFVSPPKKGHSCALLV